jgi:hypothetical protein
MKLLKASTIMLAGSIAFGLLIAAGSALTLPELLKPLELLYVFGAGVLCGLAICGPIAAALGFRVRLRRWIQAHGFEVQWYGSILMALALGYLFGSLGHKVSTFSTALALTILYLCALAKLLFGLALRDGDPPSSGPGLPPRPRPPLAPVPRPTRAPRRVFSEAAEIPAVPG